jgi:hypothetical protein
MRCLENQFDVSLYDSEAIKFFRDQGFTDESWGNDASPKFAYTGTRSDFEVWIETSNPESREYPWSPQFLAKIVLKSSQGVPTFIKTYECELLKELIKEVTNDTPDSGIFAV